MCVASLDVHPKLFQHYDTTSARDMCYMHAINCASTVQLCHLLPGTCKPLPPASTGRPLTTMSSVSISLEQALSCCAAHKFAQQVAAQGRTYADIEELVSAARHIWWHETGVPGWLEALAAHPKIGDKRGVEDKPAAFGEFSRGEQAAAAQSLTSDVHAELLAWNQRYLDKFGFIFIIFAKGAAAARRHALSVWEARWASMHACVRGCMDGWMPACTGRSGATSDADVVRLHVCAHHQASLRRRCWRR